MLHQHSTQPQLAILQILCQGHEGQTSHESRSETSLTSLLRTPSMVADFHGANRSCDLRNKETFDLGETPTGRRRLLSDSRLRRRKTTETKSEEEPKSQEVIDVEEDDQAKETIDDSSDESNSKPARPGEDQHRPKFPPSPPKHHFDGGLPSNLGQNKFFGMMADLTSAGRRRWNALTDSFPSNKPWWTDMLASPAKRKATMREPQDEEEEAFGIPWQPHNNWESFSLPPALEHPSMAKPSSAARSSPMRRRRKDLYNTKTKAERSKLSKASVARAVEIATNMHESVISKVEKEYYANSSVAAKKSKRNTVLKVLKAAKADFEAVGIQIGVYVRDRS